MGTFSRVIVLIVFVANSTALAVGFSAGSNYTANLVQGEVFVQCQNPQTGAIANSRFQCREMVLDPVEFDFFEGPRRVYADSVNLTATWENGQIQKKSARYDAQNFRTENRVNLWVRTLLQKPLLDYGVNQLKYELKSGSNTVTSGEFSVKVMRGRTMNCAARQYFSPNPNDCENQFSMCSRYISEARDCE